MTDVQVPSIQILVARAELDPRIKHGDSIALGDIPKVVTNATPETPAKVVVAETVRALADLATYDTIERTIVFNDSTPDSELTRIENGILDILTSLPDTLRSRYEVYRFAWGYDPLPGFGKTMRTQIGTLRKKLGPIREHLITNWGAGWTFVTELPPEQ